MTPAPFQRRVLFVNANETQRPYRVAPLGLAFVAAATQRAGHEVRFQDLLEAAADWRQLRATLAEWQPHYLALGIRNLDNSDFHAFETYLQAPAEIAAQARKWRPEMKIIVGGPAATVDPEAVWQAVRPDHVILGEGEESLAGVIARLEAAEKLPRIIGAADGGPFRVASPAALPAPRLYQWVENLQPYLRGDAGYPLQTKRGCPLKCSYCTYGRIEGVRYRFFDPEAVADEVEGAMEAGVRDFEFVDSTFNLPPRHAIAVLEALRRRRLRANFVGTGINPSKLPDELLAAMRETGFRNVILTAESASDTMLRSYQKNYLRPQLEAGARLLRKHGLTALWVFLLGGPGETEATVEESLEFIEESVAPPNAVYITSGIRIYPGSPLADSVELGAFVREDLRQKSGLPQLQFFYSHDTPPEWLETRLRTFQRRHHHVMLSCEGHALLTHLALRVMNYLPFPKPYWQYLPALNRLRRLFLPFAA